MIKEMAVSVTVPISDNIAELKAFVDTEARTRIFIPLMIRHFTISDISKSFSLSFQYVDRIVKWMELKKWVESKQDENKSTRYIIPETVIKEIIRGFCTGEDCEIFLRALRNPVFLFIIMRSKSMFYKANLFELIKPKELRKILEFYVANAPDVMNPIDGIRGALLGFYLYRNILEANSSTESTAIFKASILEDEIFGKLVEKEQLDFYIDQLSEVVKLIKK